MSQLAQRLYREALDYCRREYPDEIRLGRVYAKRRFSRVPARQFMEQYVWVVYAAGFRVAVVEKSWPRLERVFHNFDVEKIARMRSTRTVETVFANPRKARCVLAGARLIWSEGYRNFRERIARTGTDALTELPGIGEITKDHLARNVGLENTAKNDIWIQRLVTIVGARNHDQLASYLAETAKEAAGFVDLVLWRWCADTPWRASGFSSLPDYARSISRLTHEWSRRAPVSSARAAHS